MPETPSGVDQEDLDQDPFIRKQDEVRANFDFLKKDCREFVQEMRNGIDSLMTENPEFVITDNVYAGNIKRTRSVLRAGTTSQLLYLTRVEGGADQGLDVVYYIEMPEFIDYDEQELIELRSKLYKDAVNTGEKGSSNSMTVYKFSASPQTGAITDGSGFVVDRTTYFSEFPKGQPVIRKSYGPGSSIDLVYFEIESAKPLPPVQPQENK